MKFNQQANPKATAGDPTKIGRFSLEPDLVAKIDEVEKTLDIAVSDKANESVNTSDSTQQAINKTNKSYINSHTSRLSEMEAKGYKQGTITAGTGAGGLITYTDLANNAGNLNARFYIVPAGVFPWDPSFSEGDLIEFFDTSSPVWWTASCNGYPQTSTPSGPDIVNKANFDQQQYKLNLNPGTGTGEGGRLTWGDIRYIIQNTKDPMQIWGGTFHINHTTHPTHWDPAIPQGSILEFLYTGVAPIHWQARLNGVPQSTIPASSHLILASQFIPLDPQIIETPIPADLTVKMTYVDAIGAIVAERGVGGKGRFKVVQSTGYWDASLPDNSILEFTDTDSPVFWTGSLNGVNQNELRVGGAAIKASDFPLLTLDDADTSSILVAEIPLESVLGTASNQSAVNKENATKIKEIELHRTINAGGVTMPKVGPLVVYSDIYNFCINNLRLVAPFAVNFYASASRGYDPALGFTAFSFICLSGDDCEVSCKGATRFLSNGSTDMTPMLNEHFEPLSRCDISKISEPGYRYKTIEFSRPLGPWDSIKFDGTTEYTMGTEDFAIGVLTLVEVNDILPTGKITTTGVRNRPNQLPDDWTYSDIDVFHTALVYNSSLEGTTTATIDSTFHGFDSTQLRMYHNGMGLATASATKFEINSRWSNEAPTGITKIVLRAEACSLDCSLVVETPTGYQKVHVTSGDWIDTAQHSFESGRPLAELLAAEEKSKTIRSDSEKAKETALWAVEDARTDTP